MTISNHNKNGMKKVYWRDVRDQVSLIEPKFAQIVDKLSPNDTFPLYVAYYPYGAIDADTQSTLFPDDNGNYYRITDVGVSKEIVTDLGYSRNNTPLAMVLDKQIECFIDLKAKGITIPWHIYTPGKMYPFTRTLGRRRGRIYAPNGLLCSTAGVRSAFMLPNIGCATNHFILQKEINISSQTPKSLYEHWGVFKEIASCSALNSDWRCSVLYFSEKWCEKLNNDDAWRELKLYLHEVAWNDFEFEINKPQYEIIFSIIQQQRNLKPNPYLSDTAKHLFTTALGAAPGYIPCTEESALPLNLLQEVYSQSYGLKKYIPTIMQPVHFSIEDDKLPVYYSLQHPSTHVFSPKSRVISTTMYDMSELQHLMNIFVEELSRENGICANDNILNVISKSLMLNYFHNRSDSGQFCKSSHELPLLDPRFLHTASANVNGAVFASDAPFVRGCISINA